MKTIILCGGLGTRLSEETIVKPKPMVEIGDRPILWHIMKTYANYGYNDFLLALGYKGEYIKKYFLNYHLMKSDLTVQIGSGKVESHNSNTEDWKVQMVDTGKQSLTGGRLHRMEELLRPGGTFMLTYGDGVTNLNISELVSFHKKHGKLATMSAVRPPARFGTMAFAGDQVVEFKEKAQTGEGWINGGYFVFEPQVFDYLHGDETVLEETPLENLAHDGQLMAYKHKGYWQCMDTLRDKNVLNKLWAEDRAEWKIW
jgi:glucose-1-phosphate cytidylyltransferase